MLKIYWDVIIKRQLPKIGIIVIAAFVESVLQVANLGMVIPFVMVVLGDSQTFAVSGIPFLNQLIALTNSLPRFQAALIFAGLILGLVVAKNVFTVTRSYLSFMLTNAVRYDLTARLFSRYIRADYLQLIETPKGKVLYNIWDPPIQVAEVMRAGAEVLASLLQMLVLTGLLFVISLPLTLLALFAAGVGVGVYQFLLSLKVRAVVTHVYELIARSHAWASDAMDGVRQVKAFAAEPWMIARLEETFRAVMTATAREGQLRYLPVPFNEILSTAAVLGLLISALFVPVLQLPSSYIITFILALQRVAPAVSNLLTQKIALDAARKNIAVISSIFATLLVETSSRQDLPPGHLNTLALQDVHFAYPGQAQHMVLKNISLEFRRQQVTALVGLSGAGKSTIADLIVRLVHPQQGQVLADGKNIEDFALPAWRRQIGFVSQDPFLFNMSIRDNIALAAPESSMEGIIRAAKEARIHEFIATLPEGYQTNVGDRGVKLSGGQRQRIAIARALLTRPTVLIFDEATSALDNLSERFIQETIAELRSTRIVIIIAHRMSTIENADKVIVLDHGQVVEQGTHADLLQHGGLYSELYSAQEPDKAAVLDSVPENNA